MGNAPFKKTRLDAGALWEYAVRLLAGHARSTGEIRTKLSAKAADAADVDPILARLKECGYLNDKRFAESYAVARLENQGLGKSRVIRDLRARRVAPELAARAAAAAYAQTDEIQLIEAYLDRRVLRMRSGALLEDPKALASAYRKLVHAGFQSGAVLRVLKRRAKDPETVDSFEPPEEEPGPDATS